MAFKKAFTIVELLVVIIVIAVLVTLSTVGYSGISSKATVRALQSDLTNAKKQLLSFQAQSTSNSFPTAINCVSPSATEICIRPTGGTTFTYNVNNTSNPPTFNLTATSGTTKYWINNSSVASTAPNIVTDGLVVYLDAANPASYPGTGTTWYDLSSNSNNMILRNGPTFVPENSGGIMLDGVDDYINSSKPSTLSFTGNFTFDVWVKFNFGDSIGNGAHIIGSNGRGDGLLRSANGFNTHLTIDGSGNLKSFTFGGSNDYDSGFDMAIKEIANVGMLHNALTNKAAIKNGQISSYHPSWCTQDFGYLIIGGEHNESGYFTILNFPKITVYSVKVYNRTLSQSEITQNFNALRSRYGI